MGCFFWFIDDQMPNGSPTTCSTVLCYAALRLGFALIAKHALYGSQPEADLYHESLNNWEIFKIRKI